MQNKILSEIHKDVSSKLENEIKTLTIKRAVVGIFFTGVELSNGVGGMSATPIKAIPEAVCCPNSTKALPNSGKIKGSGVTEVLEDLHSPYQLRRAIAIAMLNALIEILWQRDGMPKDVNVLEGETFLSMNIKKDDKVALVGAFIPFIKELIKREQNIKVLELDPTTLRAEEMKYFAPANRANEVVPWADVLISTGTTLTNQTLDELLSFVKDDSQVALIGPTVPLYPKVFKKYKVTTLGGVRVTDAKTLLDVLSEGGSGYQFFDKTALRVTLNI